MLQVNLLRVHTNETKCDTTGQPLAQNEQCIFLQTRSCAQVTGLEHPDTNFFLQILSNSFLTKFLWLSQRYKIILILNIYRHRYKYYCLHLLEIKLHYLRLLSLDTACINTNT